MASELDSACGALVNTCQDLVVSVPGCIASPFGCRTPEQRSSINGPVLVHQQLLRGIDWRQHHQVFHRQSRSTRSAEESRHFLSMRGAAWAYCLLVRGCRICEVE